MNDQPRHPTIDLAAYRSCPGDTPKTKGWTFFCRILAEVDPSCGQLRPSAIFDEDGGPSEHSKILIETSYDPNISPLVFSKTHTKLRFIDILKDKPDKIPQNVTAISILRDPMFRETLAELQSKYQKRIIPKINPLLPVSSSTTTVLEPTTMNDHTNPLFKQTPDDESIATQEVGSESVQSDDSQSTCVNSDESTSDFITLQTELPPSEDTDPLFLDSVSVITHSLSARLHSAADSDEAMAIVTLLHSLLSAPPIAHTITDPTIPPDAFNIDPFEEDEIFDVTERFSVSLFDEDDESLVKSLNRCNSVCNLVPPDQCIDDIPAFVDMLVTLLTSKNGLLTLEASTVLSKIIGKGLNLYNFLQQYWDYIKIAFKDGSIGARFFLLLTCRLISDHISGRPFSCNSFLRELFYLMQALSSSLMIRKTRNYCRNISPFHLLHHPLLLHSPEITLIMKPWLLKSVWKHQLPRLFSATETTKKNIINHVFQLATALGLLYPILNTSSASVYSRCGLTTRLCRLLISPVPSIVSLVLAFLARLVHLSDKRGKMEMVLLGVIDYVVVAVSQSSFLEDYENGIALIGDLLRAVRQDEQDGFLGVCGSVLGVPWLTAMLLIDLKKLFEELFHQSDAKKNYKRTAHEAEKWSI
ncbi:hypothetical protein BLNAU_14504 [Blattamonas nauphoetae]|uniref:Uncharacterized protein n=1 Tax=Blattamonas nauphoetae TaxID=2049346 RepID=A0ABQ9XDE2_9EUKA|nr:hypothetical protein BLNAU_14504 [Blattamonas nauphoetae]